ncbi:MAG: VWA domain-containing protein [Isosphaeraceae bacterium]|nr:VWA domain-containing protein [Isosphaeraceae bacterium]
MGWEQPAWFLLVPVIASRWLFGRRASISWPCVATIPKGRWSSSMPLRARGSLEFLVSICLIVALAGPRTVAGTTRISTEGVAIALVVDRSSSMNAPDFRRSDGTVGTRWESAIETAKSFIAGRPNDRIAVTAFANLPELVVPPTLDHSFAIDVLQSLRTANAGDDGTNLGDAIVWAVESLRETKAIRKRIVLLSDGRDSPQRFGDHRPVDPETAARLARSLGIVLDTIAVGGPGGVIRSRAEQDLLGEVGGPDRELLSRIAVATGGRMRVAGDAGELERAFREIDALERSSMEQVVATRYREYRSIWVVAALLGVVGFLSLDRGRGRILP